MNSAPKERPHAEDKHSPPRFGILNDNLLFAVYDGRGRLMWGSELPHDGHELIGRPIYEMVAEQDQQIVRDAIAECVLLNQVVKVVLHAGEPPPTASHLGVRDYQCIFMPMDLLNAGFCVISNALPLNHREIDADGREVLAMLADDLTLKEIAAKLHLSESAIDSRIKKMKVKLGRNNLAGLVAAATRYRLI